jgi:hypothetical protein
VVRDIVVWDLEMIPDLEGYATSNKLCRQVAGRGPSHRDDFLLIYYTKI